ncbi:hypothetical protein SteCoe_32277 [Stentor coeruleus]|uniref:Non-haem dioxygenase N-terminal domain-containing protein n=1 Tax=Stentor coeruleus TaxID=5963 RepID=A0A1R2AZE7_9CILI|nr:hypothetical protein SteCoe_32277 [Stentor coeruleus]
MLNKLFTRFLSHKLPINLKFADLNSTKNLSNELFEAFSNDGLGLLTISGIPNFPSQRAKLLALSYELSHLSVTEKAKIEHPESGFQIGWKEGQSQYPCGTFAANPLDDYNQELYYQNLWPGYALPALRPAFRELSTTILNTVFLISFHIDKYLETLYPYTNTMSFEDLLYNSRSHIGSLSHFLSFRQNYSESNDKWKTCNDVFCAYTCPVYVNTVTSCPLGPEIFDYETGIVVLDYHENQVHIKLNSDMLVIQVGKIAQILSGGVFQPKKSSLVHSEKFSGTGRSEFRMSLNPNNDCELICPDENNAFSCSEADNGLKKNWKAGVTFANIARVLN